MLVASLLLALAAPPEDVEVQRPAAAPRVQRVEARRVEPEPRPESPAQGPSPTPPSAAAPRVVGGPSTPPVPTVARDQAPVKIYPPGSNGTLGLLGGGAIALGGVGVRFVGISRAARNLDYPGQAFGDLWSWGALGTILVGGGLTAVGFGARSRGQWDAHQDLYVRRSAPRLDPQRRQVAGWSMVGGGAAIWLGTRILVAAALPEADDAGRLVVASELGYFIPLGLVTGGLVLALHADGYRDWARRIEILERVSITPGRRGVAVRGRF